MKDLPDHDALMGELLEGYQAKLEAAQAENLALLERVAVLKGALQGVYDNYTDGLYITPENWIKVGRALEERKA